MAYPSGMIDRTEQSSGGGCAGKCEARRREGAEFTYLAYSVRAQPECFAAHDGRPRVAAKSRPQAAELRQGDGARGGIKVAELVATLSCRAGADALETNGGRAADRAGARSSRGVV